MKYTYDKIEQILLDKGYTVIKDEYINHKEKIPCCDNEGYKVLIVFNKIIHSNSKPMRFHCSNPYTIDNINHYAELNGLASKCISKEYIDTHQILDFLCDCGTEFKTTWNCFQSRHKIMCDDCVKKNVATSLGLDIIKQRLFNYGLSIIPDCEGDVYIRPYQIRCIDTEGYKYIAKRDAVSNKKRPAFVHKSNPYSIYNINLYLQKYFDKEYICLSETYENSDSELTIQHNCGRTFPATWRNLNRKATVNEPNRHGTKCPFCEANRLESAHALILKQVWAHEVLGTICEDRSCVNPKTNCAMPTDIVNHNLKIAIEIQSWFHDKDIRDRWWKDQYKQQYWISQGYDFFAIDHRKFTVIGLIQLFFPYIKEVPDYVDVQYSNKMNEKIIQEILMNRTLN